MGGKIVVWPAASLWPVASLLVAELLAVGLLAGCGASGDGQRTEAVKPPTVAGAPKADDAKGTPGREAHKAPAESESSDEPKPLVLTPEEREKLGITTAPAQAITFTDSSTAFGVVLSHDSIAQAVADLETAAGAAHLSEIALTRAQKLATGPGALGVDTLETLQKQKSADQAAFSLARRKITAVVGVRFPWQGAESDAGVLNALASGDAKLVRATFRVRRVRRSRAQEPANHPTGARRRGIRGLKRRPDRDPRLDAPQDPNLPGRSFFALLRKTDIAEGSRLQVLPYRPRTALPAYSSPQPPSSLPVASTGVTSKRSPAPSPAYPSSSISPSARAIS